MKDAFEDWDLKVAKVKRKICFVYLALRRLEKSRPAPHILFFRPPGTQTNGVVLLPGSALSAYHLSIAELLPHRRLLVESEKSTAREVTLVKFRHLSQLWWYLPDVFFISYRGQWQKKSVFTHFNIKRTYFFFGGENPNAYLISWAKASIFLFVYLFIFFYICGIDSLRLSAELVIRFVYQEIHFCSTNSPALCQRQKQYLGRK